jgi:hypothetical protein
MMPQLLLTNSARSVDLVPKDKERNLGQFLDGKQGI